MPSRRTVLAATAGVTAALAAGGTARADDRRPEALLSRMTLREKVGQVFVSRVHGHSATAPDPADADANLTDFGVRTAAELLARYRLGGIIYFTWANNTRDPRQIAELSDGLQRASLAQPRGLPVLISTDQEHGVVCRVGRPAALFPGAMAIGAGGDRADARTLGLLSGRELRAMGIQPGLLPRRRRQRRPGQPGDRRPLLRRRPGGGGRPGRGGDRGLPGGRGGGDRQALPRARRHRRRQPHRLPRHHPHAARSGRRWTRRPSARRSRPASTPS